VIHPEDRHPGGGTVTSSVNGLDEGGPLLSSEDEDSDEDSDDEDLDSYFQPSGGDGARQPDGGLDMSNVGWKDVDEEFAEYFGDDDDFEESDTESIRSERTEVVEVGKRKRGENPAVADPEGDTNMEDPTLPSDIGSRLAKRQRIARERAAAGSSLRDVEVSVDENVDADVAPATNGSEESGDESLADELERELLGLEDGDDATKEGG
jgi:hypothetical protein